jgi:hypothetical protein
MSVKNPNLKKIHHWVYNQEKQMLKGKLPAHKVEALNSIGTGIEKRRQVKRVEASERLKELEQFYNENGGSLRGLWKKDPALFKWYHYHKKHLERLNDSEREFLLSFI